MNAFDWCIQEMIPFGAKDQIQGIMLPAIPAS
jgi:hypothetical protein